MRVTSDKNENLRKAREGVLKAAEGGARLVMLPEMFVCPFDTRFFRSCAEPVGGRVCGELSDLAKETGVTLIGGSFPEEDGEKLYNTCFVFDESGAVIAKHRKAHLYDVDIPGGITIRESDSFGFGGEPDFFEVDGHRFGLVICFDIRFPEYIRMACLGGAEALFVPAAFNMKTGPMHWELLFRSRAVDNQFFAVSCSPAHNAEDEYVSYGHSLVCDPWGNVMFDAGEDEGTHIVEIDLAETGRVREQLPLLKLRRPSVYGMSR